MDINKLVKLLIEKELKIATAESCTGGLLAKTITDASGASKVFEMGLVAYANRIKEEYLGVPSETLERLGAVSQETADYMARGIVKAAKSDIGVGITGIAGPTGGTKEKPVGLVYFSIYYAKKDLLISRKLLLDGSRDEVRNNTVENVVAELMNMLK